MASNNYLDEVFVAKRRPKNPIKFKVQLNDEQKKAKELILQNPITVLKGAAGSGKTMVATQVALDLLFTKHIDKIIITRPTVSKESIGLTSQPETRAMPVRLLPPADFALRRIVGYIC